MSVDTEQSNGLRILHVVDHLGTREGGPARSVAYLSHFLRMSGHEVIIAYRHWGTIESEMRSYLGPDDFLIPLSHTRVSIQDVARGCDIAHFHSVFTPGDWWDALRVRAAQIPYVVSPRGQLDVWALSKSRFRKKATLLTVAGHYLRHASTLHATALGEQEQIRNVLSSHRVMTVPNFIEPSILHSNRKLGETTTHGLSALFLGRLVDVKRPDLLIEALATIPSPHNWNVEIAGEGPKGVVDHVMRLVETRELTNRVRFHGFVPGDARLRLIRQATVLVLPSSQENFSHSVFEALGQGCLVIASETIDIAPELVECPAAFVVQQDARHIADAMVRIAKMSRAERLFLRRQGRSWVSAYLDPTRRIEEYAVMYEEATRSGTS